MLKSRLPSTKLPVCSTVAEMVSASTVSSVRAVSPYAEQIARLLVAPNVTITSVDAQTLEIVGLTSAAVGEAAASAGLVLHELTPLKGSLEDAYMNLTADSVEYRTVDPHSSTSSQLTSPPLAPTEEVAR